MKGFFRVINFLLSMIGTFFVICLIIMSIGGSLELISNSFGFLIVLFLSILINLVMDYVIHDM